MADARRVGCKEELFRINQGDDLTGRLADVANHCRQLPLYLRLPVQWLNECLNKAEWKELRQRSQDLPSLCDTMVRFYHVNFWPHFFLFFYSYFLTLIFLLLAAYGGHE